MLSAESYTRIYIFSYKMPLLKQSYIFSVAICIVTRRLKFMPYTCTVYTYNRRDKYHYTRVVFVQCPPFVQNVPRTHVIHIIYPTTHAHWILYNNYYTLLFYLSDALENKLWGRFSKIHKITNVRVSLYFEHITK